MDSSRIIGVQQTRNQIGTISSNTKNPQESIGSLFFFQEGQKREGVAVLLSENHIITSIQNIVSLQSRQFSDKKSFVFKSNNEEYLGVKEIYFDKSYIYEQWTQNSVRDQHYCQLVIMQLEREVKNAEGKYVGCISIQDYSAFFNLQDDKSVYISHLPQSQFLDSNKRNCNNSNCDTFEINKDQIQCNDKMILSFPFAQKNLQQLVTQIPTFIKDMNHSLGYSFIGFGYNNDNNDTIQVPTLIQDHFESIHKWLNGNNTSFTVDLETSIDSIRTFRSKELKDSKGGQAHNGAILSLCKLQSYYAATCSEDKQIKVWNWRTGKLKKIFKMDRACRIVLGMNDYLIGIEGSLLIVIDWKSKKVENITPLKYEIILSNLLNSHTIVTVDSKQNVQLFTFNSSTKQFLLHKTLFSLFNESEKIQQLCILQSNNNSMQQQQQYVCLLSSVGKIYTIDVQTNKNIQFELSESCLCILSHPTVETYLIASLHDGNLIIYDSLKGKIICNIFHFNTPVKTMDSLSNNKIIVSYGNDYQVISLDKLPLSLSSSSQGDSQNSIESEIPFITKKFCTGQKQLSHLFGLNEEFFFSCDINGRLRIWQLEQPCYQEEPFQFLLCPELKNHNLYNNQNQDNLFERDNLPSFCSPNKNNKIQQRDQQEMKMLRGDSMTPNKKFFQNKSNDLRQTSSFGQNSQEEDNDEQEGDIYQQIQRGDRLIDQTFSNSKFGQEDDSNPFLESANQIKKLSDHKRTKLALNLDEIVRKRQLELNNHRDRGQFQELYSINQGKKTQMNQNKSINQEVNGFKLPYTHEEEEEEEVDQEEEDDNDDYESKDESKFELSPQNAKQLPQVDQQYQQEAIQNYQIEENSEICPQNLENEFSLCKYRQSHIQDEENQEEQLVEEEEIEKMKFQNMSGDSESFLSQLNLQLGEQKIITEAENIKQKMNEELKNVRIQMSSQRENFELQLREYQRLNESLNASYNILSRKFHLSLEKNGEDQEQIKSEKDKCRQLEDKYQNENSKVESLTKKQELLQNEIFQLKQSIEDLKKELVSSGFRSIKLEYQDSQAQKSIANSEEQKNRIKELEETIEKMEQQIEQLQEKMNNQQNDYENKTVESQKEIEQQRNNLQECVKELNLKQDLISSQQTEIAHLTALSKNTSQQIIQQSSHINQLEQSIKDQHIIHSDLIEQIKQSNEQQESSKIQVSSLMKSLQLSQELLQSQKLECQELSNKLELLQCSYKQQTNELCALQQKMVYLSSMRQEYINNINNQVEPQILLEVLKSIALSSKETEWIFTSASEKKIKLIQLSLEECQRMNQNLQKELSTLEISKRQLESQLAKELNQQQQLQQQQHQQQQQQQQQEQQQNLISISNSKQRINSNHLLKNQNQMTTKIVLPLSQINLDQFATAIISSKSMIEVDCNTTRKQEGNIQADQESIEQVYIQDINTLGKNIPSEDQDSSFSYSYSQNNKNHQLITANRTNQLLDNNIPSSLITKENLSKHLPHDGDESLEESSSYEKPQCQQQSQIQMPKQLERQSQIRLEHFSSKSPQYHSQQSISPKPNLICGINRATQINGKTTTITIINNNNNKNTNHNPIRKPPCILEQLNVPQSTQSRASSTSPNLRRTSSAGAYFELDTQIATNPKEQISPYLINNEQDKEASSNQKNLKKNSSLTSFSFHPVQPLTISSPVFDGCFKNNEINLNQNQLKLQKNFINFKSSNSLSPCHKIKINQNNLRSTTTQPDRVQTESSCPSKMSSQIYVEKKRRILEGLDASKILKVAQTQQQPQNQIQTPNTHPNNFQQKTSIYLNKQCNTVNNQYHQPTQENNENRQLIQQNSNFDCQPNSNINLEIIGNINNNISSCNKITPLQILQFNNPIFHSKSSHSPNLSSVRNREYIYEKLHGHSQNQQQQQLRPNSFRTACNVINSNGSTNHHVINSFTHSQQSQQQVQQQLQQQYVKLHLHSQQNTQQLNGNLNTFNSKNGFQNVFDEKTATQINKLPTQRQNPHKL